MTEKEKKSIDKEQRIVVDSKENVIQKDNELLVIDQHAAHERIFYEKLFPHYGG